MPNLTLYQVLHATDEVKKIANITTYEYYRYTERDLYNIDDGSLIKRINEVADKVDLSFWEFIINYNFKLNKDEIFIVDNDTNQVLEITGYTRKIEENGGEYEFILKGFENFMSKRIASRFGSLDSAGNYLLNANTLISGTLSNAISTIYYDAFLEARTPSTGNSDTTYANRPIDFFNNININLTNDPQVNYSFRLKNVKEILEVILDDLKNKHETNYRIYCRFNQIDKKIDWFIDEVADKSDLIKFSIVERKNVLNNEIKYEKDDEFTVSFVAGEGEGVDRKSEYVVEDPNFKGTQLREFFVNASDIQNKDSSGNPIYTDSEYRELLANRGIEKINESKSLFDYSFEVSEKEIDYKVGDFVELKDDFKIRDRRGDIILEYETIYILPVAEINISNEKNKKTVDIILGEAQSFQRKNARVFKNNIDNETKK